MKISRLSNLLPIALLLCLGSCHKKTAPQTQFNVDPILELAHFDRHAVKESEPHLERFLTDQHFEVGIPTLGVMAHLFAWGGETGGPWTRILSFYREKPNVFQRQFVYTGEYPMTIMGGEKSPNEKGDKHSLGDQLTEVAKELGPDVYLDPEKMKALLRCTMTQLLGCDSIRRSFMDSLDLSHLQNRSDFHMDYKFRKDKEFLSTLQKVKQEITQNPDPNVLFFYGELINGIWKGTVRQYDHTGRYCIELDYLNGKFAWTLWL